MTDNWPNNQNNTQAERLAVLINFSLVLFKHITMLVFTITMFKITLRLTHMLKNWEGSYLLRLAR